LTTPEQLALLLATADAPYLFGTLKRVVLDELHALVTSKRGDLLSLGLARLFQLAPGLQMIGLSATVADPEDLSRFLVPQPEGARKYADQSRTVLTEEQEKSIVSSKRSSRMNGIPIELRKAALIASNAIFTASQWFNDKRLGE
jgi:Lhr-like helicase